MGFSVVPYKSIPEPAVDGVTYRRRRARAAAGELGRGADSRASPRRPSAPAATSQGRISCCWWCCSTVAPRIKTLIRRRQPRSASNTLASNTPSARASYLARANSVQTLPEFPQKPTKCHHQQERAPLSLHQHVLSVVSWSARMLAARCLRLTHDDSASAVHPCMEIRMGTTRSSMHDWLLCCRALSISSSPPDL